MVKSTSVTEVKALEKSEQEKKHKIVVFVNGEKYELESETVQVKTLIELGGGNPKEYELQKRKGEGGPIVHTYKDPEEVIHVKNGDHFITHFIGPINPS